MTAIQRGWKYYNCGTEAWTTRQFKGIISQNLIATNLKEVSGVVVDNYEQATLEEKAIIAPLLNEGLCECFGTMGIIDGDYRIGGVEERRAAEKAISTGMMSREIALRDLMNV